MNIEEHLLTIMAEECGEVAGQISKALRFGMDEQRDLPTSNRERINGEWNDVLAMVELLKENKIIDLQPDPKLIEAKKQKVKRYMEYSKSLGTLKG